MNAYDKLETVLKAFGLPWAEEIYNGTAKRYITYVEELNQEFAHADNEPVDDITYFQISYFCPLYPKEKDDSRTIVRRLKKALRKEGFLFEGGIQRFGEQETWRHTVFHCNVVTANKEREV